MPEFTIYQIITGAFIEAVIVLAMLFREYRGLIADMSLPKVPEDLFWSEDMKPVSPVAGQIFPELNFLHQDIDIKEFGLNKKDLKNIFIGMSILIAIHFIIERIKKN